jgi:hypothetical protein
MPDVSEPDANEQDHERVHRVRVLPNPRRWTWLTHGEWHDHQRAGSIVEESTPASAPQTPAPVTPAPTPPAVPAPKAEGA